MEKKYEFSYSITGLKTVLDKLTYGSQNYYVEKIKDASDKGNKFFFINPVKKAEKESAIVLKEMTAFRNQISQFNHLVDKKEEIRKEMTMLRGWGSYI